MALSARIRLVVHKILMRIRTKEDLFYQINEVDQSNVFLNSTSMLEKT